MDPITSPKKVTWLTPFADLWEQTFRGVFPAGVAARNLRPLVTRYGPERVVSALKAYLIATNPLYVSIPRFAQTFGNWDNGRSAPDWLAPYGEVWQKRMGGAIPISSEVALRALHADPGPDRLCRALDWYLRHTESRFISIEGFAGKWKKIELEMKAKTGGGF